VLFYFGGKYMKLLNKVRIGIYDYKIKEQAIIINDCHRELGGQIDYENLIIKLKTGLNDQHKKQTLWHELMHGIVREYNIDFENDEEEDIIDTLGTAIVQVLKDNKGLI
jgi:hypothetical protein